MTQQKLSAGGSKKITIAWIVLGILLAIGLLWPDQPFNRKGKSTAITEQTQKETLPVWATPFVHKEMLTNALKWTTEDVAGSESTITLSGFDSQQRLINCLTIYRNAQGCQLYQQDLVRYSKDQTQIAIQHFLPATAPNALTFADKRNVSEVGDVLTRTTTYCYHQNGSRSILDNVVVAEFPFTDNSNQLQYHRDATGQLQYVTMGVKGEEIKMDANSDFLEKSFDLFKFFGQYS